MTLIRRFHFTREELHHRSVDPRVDERCSWCGSLSGHDLLYEYRVETDGGSSSPLRGRFCSVSCLRSYHY